MRHPTCIKAGMTRNAHRLLWLSLAYASLGLAAIGLVVPGMPTTVFVLIAAWAASRGCPVLRARLESHPRYGTHIQAWHEEGAIPANAKRLAIIMMALSWVALCLLSRDWRLAALLFGLFGVIAAWMWSRPEPGQAPRKVHGTAANSACQPQG